MTQIPSLPTYKAYGRIDGLVNNAAIFANIRYCPFDEITVDEWDSLMAVNVKDETGSFSMSSNQLQLPLRALST